MEIEGQYIYAAFVMEQRQVYTYLNAAPVPDVSSKEHHEPCVHFDVNAAGEGHWYRRRLSQVQRVFR